MTIKILAYPKERNRRQNPYNFLLYRGMSDSCQVMEFDNRRFTVGDANILHIHWPDLLLRDRRRWRLHWRFGRLLRAIDRLRSRGGKLVWTVHNLKPHGMHSPQLVEKYLNRFIEKVDGLIFLSAASRNLFLEKYSPGKNIPYSVIPHMHLKDFYPIADREKIRRDWDVQEADFVVGVFGKIRPHKGIEAFTAALNQLPKEACRILLAGESGKSGPSRELQEFIDLNPNILKLLRHIKDEEISEIFSVCDVMMLPYQDILNSGTAFLALSMNRPVIAPEIGSLPELREMVGDQWVYLYRQPLSAAKLDQALEWAKARKPNSDSPNLSWIVPAVISESTEAFYRQI